MGGGPNIREGAVAKIRLAYKLSDRGLPLESRHLTVAKIMCLRAYYRIWAEVEILRGLVHETLWASTEFCISVTFAAAFLHAFQLIGNKASSHQNALRNNRTALTMSTRNAHQMVHVTHARAARK